MNTQNLLNMPLIIIGLYAYVLLCHVKSTDYVTMVVLTGATCLAICYLKKNKRLIEPSIEGLGCSAKDDVGGDDAGVEGLANDGKSGDKPESKEGMAVGSDVFRKLSANMGPFDGLCLQSGNKESWMKSPDNTALIPNDALFTYLSSQGPLKPVFSDNSALFGPSIDGHPDSAKKMFMFANNRTSPNCCPGTFSTSTGCVCTTENQRDFIASRGGAVGGATGKLNLQDI
tara:strand:+ start:580 stop:1266 length:687 start_codon:yes stop_codon:yes gene_type:complete